MLSREGIGIVGQNVTIEAAQDANSVTETQKFRQSGINVSLKGGAVDTAMAVKNSVDRAGEVQDDRLAALHLAQAGQTLFSGGQAGMNSLKGAGDQFGALADTTRDTKATGNNGLSLRIGIGASKSSSSMEYNATTAAGSRIASEGDVVIHATGDGKGNGGDLTVTGSQIEGDNVTLAAARDLLLQAQQETSEQIERNKASSGEIGITLGSEAGIGVYVSASAAKGKGDGNGTTHAETTVDAANTLTLVSGRDTTLEGAQARGETVIADIGRNLTMTSQQDTNDYARKDQSAGIDAAFGTGGGQVSASYNQSKIDSTYTSVKEQTGIQAGEGGFDIRVGGHTQLNGAAIASAADPSRNRLETGSLGWSDLENEAEYKASSFGISASGGSGGGSVSPNISVPQHEKSGSTTQAGIADGTLIVHDGSGEGIARGVTELQQDGLKEIFDQQKVAERMEMGQVAGQVGFRAAGDIAQALTRDYADAQKQAAGAQVVLENPNASPEQRAAAQQMLDQANATMAANQGQYDLWKDGGAGKTLLHAVTGALVAGLGGGDVLGGALGAGAAELGRPLTADESRLVKELVSAGIGAVAGDGSGAATGLAGEQFNRQLHQSEIDRIKEMAGGDPQVEAELIAAACALVRCAAGIPVDDPEYAFWAGLEAQGNGDAYADARDWLLMQSYVAVREVIVTGSTLGVGGTAYAQEETVPLFVYNDRADAYADWASRNNVGTRLLGGLQAIGGGLEAAGGLVVGTTCATVAGCVGAGYLFGAGADNAAAGMNTLWTGKTTSTLGGYALQQLGLSPETAELVYGLTQLAPAGVEAFAANRVVNAEAAANQLARLSYTPIELFGAQGVQVTEEVMRTPQAQAVISQYLAAGASPNDALIYAANLIQTGKGLPQTMALGADVELIKLVPKNVAGSDKIVDYSAFFITKQEFERISGMAPSEISNYLGLPAEQGIRGSQMGFDVYSMTPKPGQNPVVFTSEVAPVHQGAYSAAGGGRQVLVPNRSQWTDPNQNKIGEIKGGGQ